MRATRGQNDNFGRSAGTALILLLLTPRDLLAHEPSCPFLDMGEARQNSQRIEQCFGRYGIELLEPATSLRVARLYRDSADQPVYRTLARAGLGTEPSPERALGPCH